MANFLSAIGRAQPATAIQNFQLRQGQILGQEKNRAVADLTMENLQQNMDIKKRQQDKGIKAERDSLKPLAVEPFLNMVEGGTESPMAKLIYDDAVGAGLVDMSQGGLGTINQKSAAEIRKRMLNPSFASKLSRERVSYWRGLYTQTSQAAAQKPEDEKLQAELQRATDGLNQSLGQDKAMSDAMAAQAEQDVPKVADFEREFLDKAFEENSETMGTAEAMKKALSDLESVKKSGKFEPKGININLGDKIQQQETAKDKAFWTGTKANEKAKDIAREDFGDTWEDLSGDQKNFETKKILDQKIKAVEPSAVFGEDGGIFGWYIPDESGQFKLIQRWNE